MIKEEYFKNLEKKVKYLNCTQAEKDILDAVLLAREVAKYTDDEKKVTRICNSLRRNGVHSIDGLMEVDLDKFSKVKNIGPDAINILRQIRGLPIKTYTDEHPFAKRAHWIDNHNGTISCGRCQTWFYKDDRYSYMHYCPCCSAKMIESEATEE